MSSLQYGSETINMGRVLNFGVDAIMSDDGIDYIATRYTVDFQGVISLDLPGGGSNTAIAKALSASMAQPRKPLRLFVGGSSQPLLDMAAPDVQGGPICNHIQFTEFAGTRTAIVNVTYTAHAHDCPSIPRVLSNRFSFNHEIDQHYYTRRTIQGELRVNPFWRLNADAARREYAFRMVPRGCQVLSAAFRQDPTGLRLAYTIVYQEKYQLPPIGSTDIRCEYNETSVGGGKTEAEIFVDVTGPKTTPKADLLAICANVALSRFNFGNILQPGKDQFTGGSIREIMHENRVSMMLSALKGSDKGQAGPLRLDRSNFGKPIPGAPEAKGSEFPIYGNEGMMANAAPWKMNVCSGDLPNIFETAWDLKAFAENHTNVPIQVTQGELPPPTETLISPGQARAPYLRHDIRVKHKKKTGIVPVPQAQKTPKDQTGGGGGGSSQEPRDRTTAAIRLKQPSTYKIIRYNCERIGEKPELPKVTVRAGLTLIKHDFEVHAPRLAPDGFTPIYTARGSIVIMAHGDIDIESEDIEVGINPTTKFTWKEGVINPPQFVPGMVEKPPNE